MSTPTIFTTDTSQVLLAEHWDGPGHWWPVFPILWFLVIAGIVATVVILRRRNRELAGPRAGAVRLAERFAAGEISEQEYRERLAVLKAQKL
jgi:putative membrane protein